MKNLGCMYLDFASIKKYFGLPTDSLLKNVEVNNLNNEIEVYFYTNEDSENFQQTHSDIVKRFKPSIQKTWLGTNPPPKSPSPGIPGSKKG